MKKLCALLLTLAISLSFCACQIPLKKDTDSAESTNASSTDKNKKLVMGKQENGVYSNEFIGIGAKLDGWTFYTEDQILAMNNLTKDQMGSDYAELMEKSQLIYDMVASDTATQANININLENIGIIYGTIMDEEAYVDNAIPQVKTQFEKAGMTGLSIEKTKIGFAGKERTGIRTSFVNNGIQVYQKQVMIKAGTYIAVITISTFNNDTCDDAISKFYTLD